MRIISYYVIHTTKNIIRKLFKSKTGIVIVIVVIAIIAGMIGTSVGNKGKSDQPAQETMAQLQKLEQKQEVLAMAGGIIILLIFLIQIATGEKKGTGIFQMPDVNLLFASPVRPQSILMFRIILQMGGYLLATVYMLFQIPNLMMNMNLSLMGACGILLTYFLMLVLGALCSIFVYCMSANYPKFKAAVRPAVYAVIAGFLLAFAYMIQIQKNSGLQAGLKVFGGDWFYQIPMVGWLKGIAAAFIQNNLNRAALYGMLIVLAILLLLIFIYRTPVDFYEDAMTGAQKTQELLNASKEGRVVNRKRTEKVDRTEGIGAGNGANAFYYKSVYNHKRFAKFHLFTPSSQLYYVICIALSLFIMFVQKNGSILKVVAVQGFVSLIMSNGAILSSELAQNFIFLVPEKEIKKVLFCSLADIRNYMMDSLPPYVIACVILRAEPIYAAGGYLVLASLYFLSVQMGTWMDLLFPSTIAVQVKTTLCIILKYLALIPAVISFAALSYLDRETAGLYVAAASSIICGAIFMFSCPNLLRKGKR